MYHIVKPNIYVILILGNLNFECTVLYMEFQERTKHVLHLGKTLKLDLEREYIFFSNMSRLEAPA